MKILQGRYLKKDDTSGKLKTIRIKTTDGPQVIKLPKALRVIAQQELSPGDLVRVWVATDKKDKKKASKKALKKNGDKHQALQLIPLSPKTNVTLPVTKAKASEKAGSERTAKRMRVQLCQKKNCCKRGGTKLWESFEQVANDPTSEMPTFKLESVGCLGGCKRGPNIRFLPANVKHYHVRPKDIEKLLRQHDPAKV